MTAVNLPDFAPDQPAAHVDAALRQALTACDRAQECAVLWFAEVQRRSLFRQLGQASLQLYATQSLGFSDNRFWAFKRLADDLERLPVLRAAVESGEVGWTKAQLVARVATGQTQAAWVAKAAATGRRELARAVNEARRPRHTGPSAPQLALGGVQAPAEMPAAASVTTIALRADGMQLARFEALVVRAQKLRLVAEGTERMDIVLAALDALLMVAAAEVPAMASTPTVQVVVHRCPDCGRAAAATSRGETTLAPAQVGAIDCDARVRVPGKANRATIAPKTRAAVLARDRHRCAAPGCGSTRFLEVHHVTPRRLGGSNRAENLVTLCGRCHRFAHESEGRLLSVAPALVPAPGREAAVAPAQVPPA